MSVLTEGKHTGEFIVSEANGDRSREVGTLLSGSSLDAGAVLGRALIDVTDVTGAADANNTGGGTIGTLSAGSGVQVGDYHAICIEPASGGGTFTVFDPKGVPIGKATAGVEFSGEVVFTISDGDPDFSSGDAFTVSVGAGSGKYKEYNPANADGSQNAVALLYDNVDASEGDAKAVVVVRDAEVNAAELAWFDGATDEQKATGLVELSTAGIIGR